MVMMFCLILNSVVINWFPDDASHQDQNTFRFDSGKLNAIEVQHITNLSGTLSAWTLCKPIMFITLDYCCQAKQRTHGHPLDPDDEGLETSSD
jgi:hypothetical protein